MPGAGPGGRLNDCLAKIIDSLIDLGIMGGRAGELPPASWQSMQSIIVVGDRHPSGGPIGSTLSMLRR